MAQMNMRAARKRLLMGLSTVLGFAPRGFFIPYRYAAQVPTTGQRPGYETIGRQFQACENEFTRHIEAIDGFAADLEAIGAEPPPQPRWRQGWFPRLDAAAAYTMVRRVKPARIVEVGSGHSTRFLARAVRDGGLQTAITAIDPAPRADIAEFGIHIHQTTVQDAGTGPFSGLAAGDILSIDSSHILMPGSDVDFLFNAILPGLPDGVYVHIHDIFLPDDYPEEWAWRSYNEQQGVGPLLQGGAYKVLWSSHYVASRMEDALSGTVIKRLDLAADAFETSLWLKRVS
ncbi:MAG: class I SAM-dependent methyltransferase [Rhodospirillales bacterium]|nr:class I SAM-dependent methyltransferase [Rhodospirillales bacterium]